jgi:Tfp pilus assembly protein PilN
VIAAPPSIDLLPPDEARAVAAARRARRLGNRTAIVAMLLALLGHGALEIATVATSRAIAQAAGEHAALERPVLALRRLQQRQATLRRRLAVIRRLEGQARPAVRLLDTLGTAVPARLWLTELTLADGGLRLAGRAADDQRIADIVARLRALPLLRGLDLEEAARDTGAGATARRFVIAGRLVSQP